MLNGRFGVDCNKFILVSVRGTSVVDHTLVPVEHFTKFSNFHINYVTDIITELDIFVDKSISDHSILCWYYSFKVYPDPVNATETQPVNLSTRLPKVKIPVNYLVDPHEIFRIDRLTSAITKLQEPSNPAISCIYNEVCSILLQELPIKMKK